ncbi:hypothetical protein QVD17_39420 [Tagetes erecta]|uniref:Uncharacterized protein n=1 Tax=Tagetes erecta TaxID=13708 RepID=A0AAD8NH40_TARER|nr:hypothetical protein QVD17_39420 [Tagetes erecta]
MKMKTMIEEVYEDHANNDRGDDVDWEQEIDPYLEDIIEYYKQTEDQLHEVSPSGHHLLIKVVSQYTLSQNIEDIKHGSKVEEQNDVKHVDEVDQDNEMINGLEVEVENGIKEGGIETGIKQGDEA